jgi:hypothetical protein
VPSAFDIPRPKSAGTPARIVDLSVTTAPYEMTSMIPYNISPAPNVDPLSGFFPGEMAVSEAERVGIDRFGEAWPFIRAQRTHDGDKGSILPSLGRRMIAQAHYGQLFTPLEITKVPLTHQSHSHFDPRHCVGNC